MSDRRGGWKVRFLHTGRAFERIPCQRCACQILQLGEANWTGGRVTAFYDFPMQLLDEAWDRM